MCCRVSFQRLLFCFLVLSLVGCDQNPQRKPREQSRVSREEVEKKLEDATNEVFAEFTRRYTADGILARVIHAKPCMDQESGGSSNSSESVATK